MRVCPKCNFQNQDSALICTACSTPLPAESSALADVDAFMADKARQKRRRLLLVLIVVVLAIVGGVVGGIVMWQKEQVRQLHSKFYESFAQADEKSYSEFWQCLYRDSTKQAFALPNNLVLNEKITKAYKANRGGFKTHVEEKCLPRLKEVSRRVSGLSAPPEYTAALERYSKSSVQVEETVIKISDGLARLYEDSSYDKKILKAADQWHMGYAKNIPQPVIAYDHFLRCAIPNFDGLKDGEAVVQELLKYYKTPVQYVSRLRGECLKLFKDPPKKVTKEYVDGYKKFDGEHDAPRDRRAFKDFFRKANKIQEAKILEPIGKAWLEYKESRDSVLKVTAKALQ